ncbi:Inner membrane ABC transporter ATP-binding protein YddA [Halomonadaceae bacterium LMG 33818]
MMIAILLMAVAMVGLNVYISYWNRQLFNALQNFDDGVFPRLVLYFLIYLIVFISIAIFQYFIQSLLQLRWRRWLTFHYIDKWVNHSRYYQLELDHHYSDNPDQRITEDIDAYTHLSLSLFIGLFSSILTLASFIGMLWHISGNLTFSLGGHTVVITHYMVWVAIIYSFVGNWLAHVIGRKLISINYYKQKVEANLRFGLVRLRENGRAIAQMKGDSTEREQIKTGFHAIWEATRALIKYNKRLLGYNSGFSNLASIFPLFAAAPQYFAKQITLGNLSQISMAFGNVQSSLSWFVSSYSSLANWRTVIERLDNFNDALDKLPEPTQRPGQLFRQEENARPELSSLELKLPDGTSKLTIDDLVLNKGENTLIEAPSGAGKSLLFGLLSGNWPFWQGKVTMPTSTFFIPQAPYLPIGSLKEVLAYPSMADHYNDDRLEEVLWDAGLPQLIKELETRAHWERILSPGEKQRISFARALLRRPQWLFLDEATAALDLSAEQSLYQLLKERMPGTTLVSIAHKNTLMPFHPRVIVLSQLEGTHATPHTLSD